MLPSFKRMRLPRFVGMALGAILLAGSAVSAMAEDMKVEARLIWGTDTENKANHKVEDHRLTEDLARIFKWKNYYQITNCTAVIASDVTHSMDMSTKCTVKIKNMGASKVEVSCFGDGKFVSKGIYSLSEGKWLTLAGSDKNDSAWFVVMLSRNPKGGD